MKKGHHSHIEQETTSNNDFRKVLYTGQHMQLVLMALQPSEDIGVEIHADNDQFFRFESGQGRVVVNGTEYSVVDGDSVIVSAGVEHNVINVSTTDMLKFYTIYAPPHHKDGIIRTTKSDAIANEADFDGITTE